MNELQPGEESLSVGVRRVASAEVDHAVRAIDGDSDPHSAVHEVRKSCKKIRAVLRLVRDAVGPECYHRENAHFRDTARRISDLRDRQAALETFDAVSPGFPLSPPERSRIRAALLERRDQALDRSRRERLLDRVATELREGQARIHAWPVPDEGFGTIDPALRRVYRRGRKGHRRSRASRTAADLHDWRKRAKYLRYQARLLRPAWPAGMKALESTLHELTDLLGDEHDLVMLLDAIVDGDLIEDDSVDGARVRAHVTELRARKQGAAWLVGERVYAERPSQFVRRLGRLWNTAPGGPAPP